MSIVISHDDCGNVLTIYANSAKLKLSIADAYQLMSHLKYTLEMMANEQVMKERREYISAVYCDA